MSSPHPLARSPSTGVRLLLFLAALGGAALLFASGFPPGAPDRFPVLLIALTLALGAAYRPGHTVAIFAFLFPCAGLIARLCGGLEPTTWPALLLGGLAVGWTFRFIYDFDSVARPVEADRALRALATVWMLATVVAVFRAATVWDALRGLSGRAVNGEGLLDGEAIRESVFSFSSLAAGAAFYFLLRRSSSSVRRGALAGALAGIAVAAATAVFQRLGLLPEETRAYWRLTKQVSGGATDPNALGLLCGLALLIAVSGALRGETRRGSDLFLALVSAVGLLLSGSRSGLLLVGLGLTLSLFAGGIPARVRAFLLALVAVAAVAAALFALRGSAGTLGSRLAQTFDPSLPVEYRMSARPLLWRAAGRLFLRNPLSGAGMGAFTWRFPDLMSEESRRFTMRDNPGSAVLQSLAETGLPGFFLTALFAAILVARIWPRPRSSEAEPRGAAAGIAAIAFLASLAVGSHWLSPDVSLLFFLLAAAAASPSASESAPPARPLWNRGMAAAVALYVAAAAASILATNRAEEAFRYSSRIGFHEREIGPGGAFRWTRRRFGVRLSPEQASRLVLAHYSPDPHPVLLETRLDDRVVFRRSLKAGEAVTLRLSAGRLPAAFVFSVSRSFVPKRLGLSDDRRELGLLALER